MGGSWCDFSWEEGGWACDTRNLKMGVVHFRPFSLLMVDVCIATPQSSTSRTALNDTLVATVRGRSFLTIK